MAEQPTFSIQELIAIMRNCQTSQEIESLVSDLCTEFDHYTIADQGFLLTMIGLAIMNITNDSLDLQSKQMQGQLLLRGLNWTKGKYSITT